MSMASALRLLRNWLGGDTPRYSIRQITAWLFNEMRHHWLQAALNLTIGILIVLLDLAFVWCSKLIIDIATGQTTRFTFTQAAIMLIGSVIINIALSYCGRWIKAILGVRAQNDMQRRIFLHLLHSQWSGMEQFHTGDLLNRIEKDVSQIVAFLTESLPAFVTAIVRFTGAFLFLFLIDRTLAVAIIVILPFFLLLSRFYVGRMRTFSRAIRQSDSEIQSTIQESLQHNIVIKALYRLSLIEDRLLRLQGRLQHQIRTRTRFSSLSAAIMQIGFSAGYLFAFLWGASRLSQGLITYGTLIAFVQLVGQIQAPLRNLTGYIPLLITTLTSAERIIDLHRVPTEEQTPDSSLLTPHSSLHTPHSSLNTAPSVVLNSVSFRYDGHRQILNNLSCTFPPGSATAVMGPTGAGKTTLVRLLLGLVSPLTGSITLRWPDGHTLPVTSATRPYFCYVPQGNTLLSGSIYGNLLLGNPQATEQQMINALRVASADFVLTLPGGIHTRVGEQGYGLSEGQAQRICIARCLLQQGPIIVLDEATSALDVATEERILTAIRATYPHKTLIIITHHLAVVQHTSAEIHLTHH